MSKWTQFGVVAVVGGMLTAGAITLRAQDAQPAPAEGQSKAVEMPAETAERAPATRPVRLTIPWRLMENLSDEQRSRIAEIHKKAVADIRAIETKEREDVLAVLSDEQKVELKAIEERRAAEQKQRAANRSASSDAAPPKPAAE